MVNTSDEIRDRWQSLGIAFVSIASRTKNADPEKAIIESLQEFQEDRKLLGLVLAWLKSNGTLVHVERIKALAGKLSAHELAWLGGLASYQVVQDDRWQSMGHFVDKKLGKSLPKFIPSKLDKVQAKKNGRDKNFLKYGLSIPPIMFADPKKLHTREALKENLWFRMRMLFGTNWRANMATVILLGLAKTSYQAEKVLGCSQEAAHRNWKALKEADVEQLLRVVV